MKISKTLVASLAVALTVLTVRPGLAEESGKPDRAKMMERIDTNRDGKISGEERAIAQAEFAKRYPNFSKAPKHRLENITFPQAVKDADASMDLEALLYHPNAKVEGKMPLIVLLHGAGGTKQKEVTAFIGNRDVRWLLTPQNSKYVAKVLVPHAWSHWNPKALNLAVDHLLKTNDDIDPDRVYCIGYSLGGLGTWNWARHSPDRLAAVVPVAYIAHQSDLEKIVELPIWAMVGTADRRRAGTIPAMEKALKGLGSKVVRTTVFEGANHGQSASLAWGQEGLLDWLFAQSLKNRKE